MRTVGLLIVLGCAVPPAGCDRGAGASDPQPPGSSGAASAPTVSAPARDSVPAGALDHARSLPVLGAVGGVLTLPLTDAGALGWRGVRDGIGVAADGGLRVSYTRLRGRPAGVALVLRPGTLAGLRTLTLSIESPGAHSLSVCLTRADGSVWTLGSVRTRADGRVSTTLRVEDAEWDPYQNGDRSPSVFDAADVYLITLLDLTGFMSSEEPPCRWTVVAAEGGVP